MQETPAARRQEIAAGAAVYTRRTLALYDLFVLGLSNYWIWKCPTRSLLDHFNRHVTANHLDVGAGTGYFLDKARFPAASPRIALMDVNKDALAFAARRIARYRPEIHLCNVLEPITIAARKFDSVSLNYLLHCLPGPMESKARAFDHIKTLMTPGAVLFGATLLHDGVLRSPSAARLMDFYNRQGIFSNEHDDADALRRVLSARFSSVSLEIIGCAALFSATA